MPESISIQVGASPIQISTGEIARQADGAVMIQQGETMVLVAAVAARKARPGQGFFPLTVDYREKASAAGRFPGGYFKREGRPSEKEILTCRLTDRPLRPLFPKGWLNEVQVQSMLLSADQENDPDILSILGASTALTISDIPWDGPLGAVRVARVDDALVANPTHSQRELSDLDLIYVGNETDMVMYEGSAAEISEADFLAALRFGQECCAPMIKAQHDLRERVGRPKRRIEVPEVPEAIVEEARQLAGERIIPALLTPGKLEREEIWEKLTEEIGEALRTKHGEDALDDSVLKEVWYRIQKTAVRSLILDEGKRLDGRGFDALRPISSRVGFLPRTHGSSLFTRGETQSLAQVTLGTLDDSQEFDAYSGGNSEKQFMLHYNFPHFSVGETGRIAGPGRREIGHGALAERSVEPVIPKEAFPYAIRVVSEITESNGSSSMATVCSSSLALMDAGVPIERPVAGVSVGICVRQDDQGKVEKYQLLNDIMGWEDAFCDMDCKIAGTAKGITGFQLDLKLRGIPHDIMAEALELAAKSRGAILESMAETLSEPREQLSPYAPRITTIRINPDKIGALIGPGGKNIRRITDESGCEINIQDDGEIKIYSLSEDNLKIAQTEIDALTAEIQPGKIYRGKVISIKEFGCFVQVFPGQDGLCHVSELANFRVKRTEDIVKIGDEIWVKCLGIDDKGRVKLSRKAAMEQRAREIDEATPDESEATQ